MNRPPISFVEKVITHVETKCFASITAGGFDYLEKIYAQYLANEKNDEWLFKYLEKQFQWLDVPPIWIEREPAWPFCSGNPMLFVAQHSIGSSHHDIAGSGYTIYLFVGRKEQKNGYQLEFREIVQSEAMAKTINSIFDKIPN